MSVQVPFNENYDVFATEIEQLKRKYSIFHKQGQYQDCIICLERIKAFGPFDIKFTNKLNFKWAKCNYLIGKNYWDEQQYKKAAKYFYAILTIDCSKASIYYYLALYEMKQKNNQKAFNHIWRAVTLQPTIIKYRQIYAELRIENMKMRYNMNALQNKKKWDLL